ncbi:MAG: ATP-binding cassette domain-containing protein, partial [Betaproteobacteria bacterium]|nr:ATP-binding cassette domain-containing protein [Betaproteobacteria bacterium]
MLEITDLKANYSGIQALRGVSLSVKQGEMVALIGPNGAGKSTLLNCVSAQVRPAGGSIKLDGQEMIGQNAWTVSRSGLLQVPEGRQVFAEMTVLETFSWAVPLYVRGQ